MHIHIHIHIHGFVHDFWLQDFHDFSRFHMIFQCICMVFLGFSGFPGSFGFLGGGGGLWIAGLLFIFGDSVGLGAESWQKMLEILGVMCLMGSMDSMDM